MPIVGRLLGLLFALALLATAAPSAQAATPTEQARLLVLVNQARAAQGLTPVTASTELNASGEAYAAYMATANFFSHTGLNGSTMTGRDEAAGYLGWTWLAENIAAGQTTADTVFTAWMNSSGHRANILDPRAREMGIGHAYSAGSTYHDYWTMELGARTSIPAPAAPAATPAPATTYSLPAAHRYRVTLAYTPRSA